MATDKKTFFNDPQPSLQLYSTGEMTLFGTWQWLMDCPEFIDRHGASKTGVLCLGIPITVENINSSVAEHVHNVSPLCECRLHLLQLQATT